MKKMLLPLVVIAGLVAACVPSVNPFYTAGDVITDPRLPGIWVNDSKDKHATWKFETATNSAYAIALTDEDGNTGGFNGHLFKLGAETFLDLTPTDCNFATNQAALLNSAMIPGHLLIRVKLEANTLNLALCDPDWVAKFLKANPSAVAHRVVNDNVVLTAETPELQKFVLRHLGEHELFGDGTDYHRQSRPADSK